MIKTWIISSKEVRNDIDTYSKLMDSMDISGDCILKGISKKKDGKTIFIVKPLSKIVNYKKLELLFSDEEKQPVEISFSFKDMVNNCEKYDVYLDKSLMYRSEYFLVDWEEHKIYTVSLERILKQLNFVAWIDV